MLKIPPSVGKLEVTQCFYIHAKVSDQHGWFGLNPCDFNTGDHGSHFLKPESVFLSTFTQS